MPIPPYQQFMSPLLLFLAQQKEATRPRDVYEAVAAALALTPDEKSQLLPSGTQQLYKNRTGWANDRLKRAGLSTSPRRGLWQLTQAGLELAERYPTGLPQSEIDRLAEFGSIASTREIAYAEAIPTDGMVFLSPHEQIERGLQEVHASVAQNLLELIGRARPEFFERLVLQLLHAMGYGTSQQDLQHVGGSGDGGIDGIISLDRLGLQRVYVQAKRWQGPVGSPVVQGFMGALQLQGADKGVLITSGAISQPAMEAAKRARGNVVLIDGLRLASLMIEHGVGVSTTTLKIPKVDADYFDDE